MNEKIVNENKRESLFVKYHKESKQSIIDFLKKYESGDEKQLMSPQYNIHGIQYKGGNAIKLAIEAHVKGYKSNVWGTFKSVSFNNLKIKKGSKTTIISYYQKNTKEDQQKYNKSGFVKNHRVLNGDSFNEEKESLLVNSKEKREEAKEFISNYAKENSSPNLNKLEIADAFFEISKKENKENAIGTSFASIYLCQKFGIKEISAKVSESLSQARKDLAEGKNQKMFNAIKYTDISDAKLVKYYPERIKSQSLATEKSQKLFKDKTYKPSIEKKSPQIEK